MATREFSGKSIVGFLVSKPELKQSKQGKPYCDFIIKDKKGYTQACLAFDDRVDLCIQILDSFDALYQVQGSHKKDSDILFVRYINKVEESVSAQPTKVNDILIEQWGSLENWRENRKATDECFKIKCNLVRVVLDDKSTRLQSKEDSIFVGGVHRDGLDFLQEILGDSYVYQKYREAFPLGWKRLDFEKWEKLKAELLNEALAKYEYETALRDGGRQTERGGFQESNRGEARSYFEEASSKLLF